MQRYVFCEVLGNAESPVASQQTRGIQPKLFQCWASVEDAGPTLKQHMVNVPCLLGIVGCAAPRVPASGPQLRIWGGKFGPAQPDTGRAGHYFV